MTRSFPLHVFGYYLPVLIWCGFIFALSSQSHLVGPESAVWDFIFKKTAHMFVYAVLMWLIFRAYNAKLATPKFLVPFFMCFVYALSDELHQALTPGRMPTLRDIGYDTLGMLITLMKLRKLI